MNAVTIKFCRREHVQIRQEALRAIEIGHAFLNLKFIAQIPQVPVVHDYFAVNIRRRGRAADVQIAGQCQIIEIAVIKTCLFADGNIHIKAHREC